MKLAIFTILCLSSTLATQDNVYELQSIEGSTVWNIKVEPGQDTTLILPGNITTGYSWYVTNTIDAKVVQPLNLDDSNKESKDYVPASSGMLGVSGKFYFHFHALAKGATTVKLSYKRDFEEGVAPLATVTANFNVGGVDATTSASFMKMKYLLLLLTFLAM
jgi:predicted secreted protein